jgi:hypothetical protein
MKRHILFVFLVFNTPCFSQLNEKENNTSIIDGIYQDHHYFKKNYKERYAKNYHEPDTNIFHSPYTPSKHILISQSKSMKCLYYNHEKAYYLTFTNDSYTFFFNEDYFWLTPNEFDVFYTNICDAFERGDKIQRLSLKYSHLVLRFIDNEVVFYSFNKKKLIYFISNRYNREELKEIFVNSRVNK